MRKYTDEEVAKWNPTAQKNRFCYESECKYYFAEIEQCMLGEEGVPEDWERKCSVDCPYCDGVVNLTKAYTIHKVDCLFEFKCYHCNKWFSIPMSEEEFEIIMRERDRKNEPTN